jgi:hypothetical protein
VGGRPDGLGADATVKPVLRIAAVSPLLMFCTSAAAATITDAERLPIF